MTKNNIIMAASFGIGVIVGAMATYFAMRKKCQEIVNKDAEELRKYYTQREKNENNKEDKDSPCLAKKNIQEKPFEEYAQKVEDLKYADYSSSSEKEKSDGEEKSKAKPYVISPDEFGEYDDYEKISLTYFDDGYLTDDCNVLVDDVEGTVGSVSLAHIGEYEDDAVHVRNDVLKVDYEILQVLDKYEPVDER